MKTYRLFQVDSFTRERFRGNPAGVALDADDMSEAQMQAIARELNNSETAFVMRPTSAGADVRVRFFTPSVEVPICGHATIAAHYVRARELGLAHGSRVVQQTLAGDLPIEILRDSEGEPKIIMTQGKPEISAPLAHDIRGRIAAALGLGEDGLDGELPVCIASTGHSKVMVPLARFATAPAPVSSLDVLYALRPDMSALCRISEEIGCNGFYVFALADADGALAHGRMFAPAIGIAEDPVTGNANGPLGAYLVANGLGGEGDEFRFRIAQGEAIGRAGGMEVRVQKRGREPLGVQIVGEAVVAFETSIQI